MFIAPSAVISSAPRAFVLPPLRGRLFYRAWGCCSRAPKAAILKRLGRLFLARRGRLLKAPSAVISNAPRAIVLPPLRG